MNKATIENRESGLSVRNKINNNFTELYDTVQSVSSFPLNVEFFTESKTFTDTDTNKVFHFDTTTESLCAIFPDSLSNGFNVALMNVGTNTIVLSSNSLKAYGNIVTAQYGGAFVYKKDTDFFAVGRLG